MPSSAPSQISQGRSSWPWTLFLLSLLCAATLVPREALGKTVLVFGPHPDDESLIAAGIVRRAITNGDKAKMVVVTNGDYSGGTSTGLSREGESVSAAQVLGLTEDDVIFLGYPDGSMRAIFDAASPSQVFTSAAGQTATYGNRGLGRMDYHRYLSGVAGSYNHSTIVSDIQALLNNFLPDEIYTTSQFDNHADHQAVGLFVSEALANAKRSGSTLSTKLYQGIVWSPDGSTWPDPSGANSCDPTLPYQQPPKWGDVTSLDWTTATHVLVPSEMLSTNPAQNIKCAAISQYRSQLGLGLLAYARKDEFFFLTDYGTNIAITAQATASSDTAGAGGARAIDGVIDGAPHDAPREWVTRNQLAGAWIQLNWSAPMRVAQVNLFDRPDNAENILSGTLSFSDGSTIDVGALPTNGMIQPVTFVPRNVTWVRFTVNIAEGTSTGLAEIQVFGKPASSTADLAPSFIQGPFPAQDTITSAQTGSLTAVATDLNGYSLQYSWSADIGTVTGNGSSASYAPPAVNQSTVVTITTKLLNGRNGTASNVGFMTVTPPPRNSLSVSPSTLYGSGSTATGTVTLLNPAPTGGQVVPLSSNNTSAATVPASVTVPAGASSATFVVTSKAVTASTPVTLSATISGSSYTAAVTVNPSTAGTLSVSPSTVGGGQSALGTVTLSSAAQAGGVNVPLASSNPPVAAVPASVTVPAGATTATFTVTTTSVTSATSITLSATIGNSTPTAALTVNPGSGSGNLLASPNSIGDSRWTIMGPLSVTLSNATSPSGAKDASLVTSTATGGHALAQTNVPVSPSTAYIFSFYAKNNGGSAASYSVYDVSHGADIVSSTPYLTQIGTVWTKVTVAFTTPAGCSTINVYPLRDSGTPVNILLWGASLITSSSAGASLSVSPTAINSGQNATATITLATAAPAGGTSVALSSNNGAATVPASVSVPAGATSASFTVATSTVWSQTVATLTATVSGTDYTTLVTVNPGVTGTVSVNPSSVTAWDNSTGTVTLSLAAPSGGYAVPLSSNNAAAAVPASITVPAGATSATFTVSTSAVSAVTTVTISATIGSGVQTTTLTVNPSTQSGNLLRSPNTMGDSNWMQWGSLTSTLAYATAPDGSRNATRFVASGGHALVQQVTVTANTQYIFSFYAKNNGGTAGSYSAYDVTHSANIVPSTSYFSQINGTSWTQVSVTFVTPAGCTSIYVYPLRDSLGSVDIQLWGASLTVYTPPATSNSLSVSPTAVNAGQSATGTVTLANAAPAGGTIVPLSSNNAAATVPANVTVPAGATSANFNVTTGSVSASTSVTLTATIGGYAYTAALTVKPVSSNPNLLRSPEAIGDANWGNWGTVSTALNAATAPDNTQHASRVTAAAGGQALVQTGVATTPGTTYTLSFYAMNQGGAAAAYSVYDATHGADIVASTPYLSQINGTTWTRVKVTFTAPAGCTSINVYPIRDSGGQVTILLWGAKLEVGSVMSAYP